MTLGATIVYPTPAMAKATSKPPAPKEKEPTPPAVGVWESEPIRVFPGSANLSK